MSKILKRHCMVVHAYYPIGEPRVQREAEALVDSGYEVDVICLRQPGEASLAVVNRANVFRLPVHRHKGYGLLVQFLEYVVFFCLASWKLTLLHFRRHYCVVQVHNLPDFLVFVAFIPRIMGARVILDIHDLMPEFFGSRFGQEDGWAIRLIRWQEWLACRFANIVITVSEHWRQVLIKRGVSKQKCVVVMNVADQAVFRTNDGGNILLPDNNFHLIYHGNMTYRYGLDLVIQAIDRVKSDIPNIHLTLLGKGDYMNELIQLVQKLNLENNVTIIDEIRPREELPDIIRSAHLGIVAYRNDSFTDTLLPTKLMEYAAMGLPAIAARTTAITAYFSNTMVEFFEPGDVDDLARCIRKLYQNPSRLVELSQGCTLFNQRYNWKNISAEYVTLVQRLCRSEKSVWQS